MSHSKVVGSLIAGFVLTVSASSSFAALTCEQLFSSSPRDIMARVQSNIQNVSAKTVGGLEALRFVELPVQVLKSSIETILAKDSYLNARLSSTELAKLAESLLSGPNQKRDVSNVIARFLFLKDHPQVKTSVKKMQDLIKSTYGYLSDAHLEKITTFLEKSVLADPQFQQNPKQFLRQWQEDRGNSESFKIPQDPALNFLEHLDREDQLQALAAEAKENEIKSEDPSVLLSNQIAKKAQDAVLAEADEYFKQNWSQFEEKHRQSMTTFLETAILPDPLFLNNPVQFISRWIDERGSQQMLIINSDPVLKYLRVLYNNGKLNQFVADAKKAQFAVKEGHKLESQEWTAKATAAPTISAVSTAKLGAEGVTRLSNFKDGETLAVDIFTKDYDGTEHYMQIYKDIDQIAQTFERAGIPNQQIRAMAFGTTPPRTNIVITIKSVIDKTRLLRVLDNTADITSARVR